MPAPRAPLPDAWPASYPLHQPILTSQARALDLAAVQLAGLSPEALMERAGLGVAGLVQAWAPASPALLVLCGPGDNGGDGYVAGQALRAAGCSVRVLDLAARAPRSPAACAARARCAGDAGVERVHGDRARLVRALRDATHVVDGLFGSGLSRALDGWWRAAVEALLASGRPVLAIDVPSGLDADTGEVRGAAVRAQVTATMVAPKPALQPPSPTAALAGRVIEVDIGLPWALHGPWRRALHAPPAA